MRGPSGGVPSSPLSQNERVSAPGIERASASAARAPDPQDIVHTTQDLERALQGAGIVGPYVMVGHSLGGLEALRFTDLHRQSVVGMVLVDPDIPDRAALEERLAPQFSAMGRVSEEQFVQRLRDCAAGLQAGTLKHGTAQFEQCTSAHNLPDVFPHLKATIAQLNADPARLLTQASAEAEHQTDGREVINAQRRYGDLPLIVLTAGHDEAAALSGLRGTPGADTPAERDQLGKEIALFLRDGWSAGHDAYAALSTRGRNQLVPEPGHNIPIEKPDVVISAINEVLNESNARLHK